MAISFPLRAHFLHVRQHLLVRVTPSCDGENGHQFVYQGNRPVLEFARRIAFGVDIGNLFQLQSAFERRGRAEVATDEQRVAARPEARRDAFDFRCVAEYFAHHSGQFGEFVESALHARGVYLAVNPSQMKAEQIERAQLSDERFG